MLKTKPLSNPGLKKWSTGAGILLIAWSLLQSGNVSSGEFVITDRIGEGTVFRTPAEALPKLNSKIVYFQGGSPVRIEQIQAEKPYCKFISVDAKLSENLAKNRNLVVRFKNVAKAKWFFDQGIELECIHPQNKLSISEADFDQTLGSYFQIEKRAVSKV